MTDFDFDTLSGALEQRVRNYLKAQPNRATVALNLANISRGSGKNIGMTVSTGTDEASEIDDGADVSTFNTDIERQATLGWTILHEAFAVTGLAEAAAANEPNELRNTPLLKLIQAAQRLASTANKRYIAGTGAGSPVQALGLTTAAGPLDNTGTYMGIDRSVVTQWQGNVSENSGTPRPITLQLLDSVIDDAYTGSGEDPEYAITTPSVWRQIADLHRDKERFTKEVMIKGEEIILQGGQTAIDHNGIFIFKDKDWTAGSLAFMRSDCVGVEFLPPPPEAMPAGDVIANIPIAGTPQEQSGMKGPARGLMAKLIRLARTGDKRKIALYLYWNVWSDRPNATALVKDLIP